MRNTDELVGIVIDSVSVSVTEPVIPEGVTIYDIQYSTMAPYISDYEDEIVTTSGIVTGVIQFGADEKRFFIQDGDGAWNGIYVYENGTDVLLGDSVTVTGKVVEYFELTEINSVSSIVIHSSGHAQPNAVEITASEAVNEEYECVLVKIINGQCTNDDAGFGQFEITDGSGSRLVDDQIFEYTAIAGNYYNVSGIAFLSFGEVKIYPRILADIEVTGYAGISEEVSNMNIYPNPASEIINLTISPEATVAIYNVVGELIYNATSNVKTINVSAFPAGLYHVVITENEQTSTQQLVVQ